MTISIWQFPLAFLLSLISNYCLILLLPGGKKGAITLISSSGIFGTVVLALFFAGMFYDISFDGQWYHQESVLQLGANWNPVKTNLEVPEAERGYSGDNDWCTGTDDQIQYPHPAKNIPPNLKYIAINHFAKGIEIVEASIYKISKHIETAKAVNGILLAATFFLSLSFLHGLSEIRTWQKWIMALIIPFNPIAVTQLLSFCVDGALACSLTCLVLTCCLLFRQANRLHLWLLSAIILIMVNIKFTSLVFTCIIVAGFLTVLLIYHKKENFKKVLMISFLAGIIGVVCCGFHPYLTNLITEGDVFYGLKDTSGEIRRNTPGAFLTLNRIEKLFLSFSSHTVDRLENNSVRSIPKIPFSFNKNDIKNVNDAEVLLSGFGPFFSGALIFAFIIFIIGLARTGKAAAFRQVFCLLIILSTTILVVPVSWVTRFIPQCWLIPVSILLLAQFSTFRGRKLLSVGLYISLGLSIAWSLIAIGYNVLITCRIDHQLSQIKALRAPVVVEYCPHRSFTSNRIRFAESQIPITVREVSGPYIFNVIYSNTRFETDVPLPSIPKSALLKWSEKMKAE